MKDKESSFLKLLIVALIPLGLGLWYNTGRQETGIDAVSDDAAGTTGCTAELFRETMLTRSGWLSIREVSISPR